MLFLWFEKLVEPFPPENPKTPPKSLVQFCRHYTRGMEWPIAIMSLLTMLIAALEVSLFGFMGQLVDWLTTQSPETLWRDQGATLIGFAILLLVVMPLCVVVHSLLIHQSLLGNFPMAVRWLGHRYLIGQSLSFFQNEFAGRIATKLLQTSLAVRETVLKLADILVYVSVYFVSILFLVASADMRFTIPLISWLILYIFILSKILPKLREVSERQADARSVMTGRIVDTYTNMPTVKLFSHAQRESDYAREGMQLFLNTVHPQMRLVTWLYSAVWMSNALLVFVTAALSIYLWMQGAVSTGAIAIAISLCLRLNGMSQWIMWEVSALFENIGTVRDGINTLSQPIKVLDMPAAPALIANKGEIEFKDVTFGYESKKPIFDHLSFKIRSGEKVGLVGRSGAGKSTLVNLLLRFYELDSGAICIDGQSIHQVTQESLRASIGMVTQDTSLLHRSVRDNIVYGRQDATEEEVMLAVRRSESFEFIQSLRDSKGRRGLDAHVGERGVTLSGGQRQRIAIARVMLKDAPILILDEATSALDSEVESVIQESLNQLMAGKTVIAIAHRLSTIAAMDRLLVLDEGQIVESGTHQELIKQNGIYAMLWAHQSGGFIGVD